MVFKIFQTFCGDFKFDFPFIGIYKQKLAMKYQTFRTRETSTGKTILSA